MQREGVKRTEEKAGEDNHENPVDREEYQIKSQSLHPQDQTTPRHSLPPHSRVSKSVDRDMYKKELGLFHVCNAQRKKTAKITTSSG
ncbi:unnamed protein product [Dovyalis caffra]|uniref:Uncharacterized protein n=1 Tax=Dovyalis caffra TaxID=77055 RepID=A0AAV1S3H9_9ROSI|nr:unnamed protein product [Dovyalis caffra]